jgi:predicted membrane GTPase involved in stress response
MFVVCGRGALHITILIENMRREGFEFTIGPPSVITKKDEATGNTLEPWEYATVEVRYTSVTRAGRSVTKVSLQVVVALHKCHQSWP